MCYYIRATLVDKLPTYKNNHIPHMRYLINTMLLA